MSETEAPALDWPEIRRILSNTRGRSSREIEAAQQAERNHLERTRPARGWKCVACPSMMLTIGERPSGERIWICDGCKRPASLTEADWQVEVDAKHAKAEREEGKKKKAPPELKPREALRQAIDDREAIQASITSLNSGLSAARSRVTNAESAVASATESLRAAEQQAVEFQIAVDTGAVNGKAQAPSLAAAQSALVDAEAMLTLAVTTRDTIKNRLAETESALGWREDRVKTAALAVLRAEGTSTSAEICEHVEEVWRLVPLLQWLVSQRAAVGIRPHSPTWSLLGNLRPTVYQDEHVTAWKAALLKLHSDPNARLPII